jgi:hypothetical protein
MGELPKEVKGKYGLNLGRHRGCSCCYYYYYYYFRIRGNLEAYLSMMMKVIWTINTRKCQH